MTSPAEAMFERARSRYRVERVLVRSVLVSCVVGVLVAPLLVPGLPFGAGLLLSGSLLGVTVALLLWTSLGEWLEFRLLCWRLVPGGDVSPLPASVVLLPGRLGRQSYYRDPFEFLVAGLVLSSFWSLPAAEQEVVEVLAPDFPGTCGELYSAAAALVGER